MNKAFLSFIFVGLAAFVDAQIIETGSFSIEVEEPVCCDLTSDTLDVTVLADYNAIILIYRQPTSVETIVLDPQGRAELRANLETYFEWNDRALAEGLLLEERTGVFLVDSYSWRFGDDNTRFSKRFMARAFFYSMNEHRHHLVLLFPEVEALEGEGVGRMQRIYLGPEHAVQLYEILSDEYIQRALENGGK